MKNDIYEPNLRKRKELLSVIAKTDSSWKLKKILIVVLFSFSVFTLIATAILLISNPAGVISVFVFSFAGIAIACVPFFIALSVKNKAKYKCAYPYSSYANGTLILNEKILQYIFWKVGPTEPAAYSSSHAVFNDEDKFVYQINISDISDLSIDNRGVCTILGNGNIAIPKWAHIPKSEVQDLSKEFSFVLAFDEENIKNNIINWRNSNG